MSDKGISLWPKDFGDIAVVTPVAVLRQQGAALGEQTQNIVLGRVETSGNRESFSQRFYLYCPPLGYQSDLLVVNHKIDLYPAQIIVTADAVEQPLEASDPEDLKEKLKEIFARPKIKKIIASLLVQSRE